MYIDYQELFPDSAEIRHLIVRRHPIVPEDQYSLNERYCGDVSCDCRRVMIEVVSVSEQACLATIVYAFDEDLAATPDGENPYLEPMRVNGPYAEALLALVAGVIEAEAPYRRRLELHYHQVRRFMADNPDHEAHETVAQGQRALHAAAHAILAELGPPSRPSPAPRGSKRGRKRRKRKEQRNSRKRNRRK